MSRRLLLFSSAAAAAVLLLSLLLAVEHIVAPPNLIEIQGKNYFDDWTNDTKNNRATLVYFYAGWSPLCKAFTKEYGKVAKYFSEGYEETLMITKMDGPNYHQLSRSLGIESFPHILLYSHEKLGEYEKYDGELSADDLIAWVKKKVHPKMKRDGKKIPKPKKKRGIM